MNRRGYGNVKMEVDTARMTLYGIDEAPQDTALRNDQAIVVLLIAGTQPSQTW